jgi:3-oxoacyl-[acyl-carrier protein] reductase
MDVLHGPQTRVIGGPSGIGHATAQLFRRPGATVHVTGTRPGPEDYCAEDVSDLTGVSSTSRVAPRRHSTAPA